MKSKRRKTMSTYDDFAIANIKILKYIMRNNNSLTKNQILAKYPDYEYQTSYRLDLMSKPKDIDINPENQLLQESHTFHQNETGAYEITYTGNYSLTTYGKAYLLDYNLHNQRNIFWEFVRSFFFPSLVALLVSAIANYLFP